MKFLRRKQSKPAVPPSRAEPDEESTNDRGNVPTPSNKSTGKSNIIKVLIQRLCLLAYQSNKDGENRTRGSLIVTLLKDVIVGTAMGVFILMVFFFLGSLNIFRVGPGRKLRASTFGAMLDPETAKSIEDSLEVKIIPANIYESMNEQISGQQLLLKHGELTLKEVEKLVNQEEFVSVREEHEKVKLRADSVLGGGLADFCGSCEWSGGVSCEKRVQYMIDTYGSTQFVSMASLLNQDKCRKK